jgi:hypothetical protein
MPMSSEDEVTEVGSRETQQIDVVHDLVELVLIVLAEAGEDGLLGSSLVAAAQARGLEFTEGRELEQSAIVYAAGIACGIGMVEVIGGYNPLVSLLEQRLSRI